MEKMPGRNHRHKLPEEEKLRVENILQRAKDKADGKLDESSLQLTEDNPDGREFSVCEYFLLIMYLMCDHIFSGHFPVHWRGAVR